MVNPGAQPGPRAEALIDHEILEELALGYACDDF